EPDGYDGRHFIIEGTVDKDGDGRRGDAENSDGDDVFADLVYAFPPVISNGPRIVTIVTDGVYKSPFITTTGNVTVQAGPGANVILDGRDEEGTLGTAFIVEGKLLLRNLVIQRFSTGVFVK